MKHDHTTPTDTEIEASQEGRSDADMGEGFNDTDEQGEN